jgi:hypothetical protein
VKSSLLVILAGCGRLAFDEPNADAAKADAPSIDATGDAPTARPFLVQEAIKSGTNGTSLVVGLDMPVSPGSMLVVATLNFNIGGTAAATTGVADGAGNSFTSANARATWTGTEGQVEIWYLPSAGAGVTVVTIDSAALTSRSAWVLELGNMKADQPLDVVNVVSDGTTNGMPLAPTVSPSRAPAVIVSAILLSGAVTQVTSGNGFVPLPSINGDAAAYAIVDAPGTYGAVWDAPGSDNYGSSTAAFLGAD